MFVHAILLLTSSVLAQSFMAHILPVQHHRARRIPSQSQQLSYIDPTAIVTSIQELGMSLSIYESSRSGGNVVLSPLSIGAMIGVLMVASRTTTHEELKNAMFLRNLNETVIHESFQAVLGNLLSQSSKNPNVVLDFASRMYLQEGYPITQRFLQIAQTLYNITTVGVDFIPGGSSTREKINGWVSDRTHGKINELFQQDFSPETRFVAVNAVYFNADWETPFDSELTSTRNFRVDSRTNIRMPMMVNIFEVRYISSDGVKSGACSLGGFDMVALPYKGGKFSMYVIVPHGEPSASNLNTFERKLYSDCLANFISNMEMKIITVQLPRMKLNQRMSLKDTLRSLGVKALFDRTQVDLGRMTSAAGIFVDDIQHEAVLEITETGTVATAATGSTQNRVGGNPSVRLNKPSLMFIRDEVSGVILFWAKVIRPIPIWK